jgi:hypothetical protein
MNGNRQQNAQLGELERVVLVIAAITVLVGAFLYAWVGLAGGLFGGGWPHLTATQLSRAIARVPAHLGDPRLAFPPRIRSQLPGPLGFYLALAVLLVGVAIAVWLALRVYQQHRAPPAGGGKRPGARWARGGDLGRLRRRRQARAERSSGASVRGLSLGYHRGGRPLRAEDRHALVVSAQRSRGSPPGSRSRTSSNGPDQRSSYQSSQTYSTQRSPRAPNAAKCSCTTRSRCGADDRTPGRRSRALRRGTPRSRPHNGSRRADRQTPAPSRAAASGHRPPSSGSHRCCTPHAAPAGRWRTSSAGCTAPAAPTSTG